MPGLHTIIYENSHYKTLGVEDVGDAMHTTEFSFQQLKCEHGITMVATVHPGYPFKQWEEDGCTIIQEGLIYNKSEVEISVDLSRIARALKNGIDTTVLVRDFVDHADGDFLIQIYAPEASRLMVFNDCCGRIATYYYVTPQIAVISREPKIVLHFLPRIAFNRSALAQFLMFEYQLGRETMFEGTYRLGPSEMLLIERAENGLRSKIQKTVEWNFCLSDPFDNYQQSLAFFCEAFLESLHNRVDTLRRNGFRILADLSGGYDSRTVMAGLSKITTDVDYFTYAYVQDESAVARAAFHAVGSPGRHHVVPDGSALIAEPIGSLVYRTDGLVNYVSTRVCTADLLALRNIVPGIGARFCGLGGNDFMRHPLRFYRHSIMYGFRHKFYSQLSLQEAASIVRMSAAILDGHIEAYVATWPEKKPNDQLKRLYNKYQNHLVNVAAEDHEHSVSGRCNPCGATGSFEA